MPAMLGSRGKIKGCPIEIKTIKRGGKGYSVLASWRQPSKKAAVDLWIPELAPRLTLMRNYRMGKIGWEEFSILYACQLLASSSQDYLKPLALLSLRRKLILVCDCPARCRHCPNRVLADAIADCRNKKNFVIDSPEKTSCIARVAV